MNRVKQALKALLMSHLAMMATAALADVQVPITDPNIVYSPYNWFISGSRYAQTPNPGAYLKVSFTGEKIAVGIDVTPLVAAKVAASHYPIVRYSIDGGPPTTLQLEPDTTTIRCAANLKSDCHSLLLQYVAGYVFLDFWTPVNVIRISGLTLSDHASTLSPTGFATKLGRLALFLGDSITNGDNTVTTFKDGVTNAVDTQDATVGYAPVVATTIGEEYGIVAYGGASWDGKAADAHTPGLMTFFPLLDSINRRLVAGRLSPIPDDVFINMGENYPPSGNDVPKLLAAIRAACSDRTNIFLIVPFSGRARAELRSGFSGYIGRSISDSHTFLIDLGNNPYLTDSGPTMLAVDGQHPLAALDAVLAAEIVQARAVKLAGASH